MTISAPGSVEPPDLSDLAAETPRRRTPTDPRPTIAVVATCVFILGMWIFVYVWGAAQPAPDKLSTPAFALQAEPICKVTADPAGRAAAGAGSRPTTWPGPRW